jgi:hypothetical protein
MTTVDVISQSNRCEYKRFYVLILRLISWLIDLQLLDNSNNHVQENTCFLLIRFWDWLESGGVLYILTTTYLDCVCVYAIWSVLLFLLINGTSIIFNLKVDKVTASVVWNVSFDFLKIIQLLELKLWIFKKE